MSENLNALRFPLWGSRLIEASAGTGKTWTIAALYLRLVLGHGNQQGFKHPLLPSEILVMTFTRAATQELSDRIRTRLAQAASCFRGDTEPAAGDAFLIALISDYPSEAEQRQAAWRLAAAAEAMDDASIFTLDAWCQRMLREHAFDSASLMQEELVANETAMMREAAHDYWRSQLYSLSAQHLASALRAWPSVDALLADVSALIRAGAPIADPWGLAQPLPALITATEQQHRDALTALSAGWVGRAQAMRQWLDQQVADHGNDWNKSKLKPSNYAGWLATLLQWAESPHDRVLDLTPAAINRLSPAGLLDARKTSAAAIDLPAEFADFEGLMAAYAALADPTTPLRAHAVQWVSQRLDALKRQGRQFGFADLQIRLDAALQGPNGAALRQRIVTQYPVALVDEFQDTSPIQYQLLDHLYQVAANADDSALLLIGDPKQSIYGFRGADLDSYLKARQSTEGRHYVLGVNYRSTQALVGAVNHWFQGAEQTREQGAFLYAHAEGNPLPFQPVTAYGRNRQLQQCGQPMPALQVAMDLQLRGQHDSRLLMAAHCAEQVVQWLNQPETGFRSTDPAQTTTLRLQPADIAILVRSRTEAAVIRQALAERGVASVYLSDKESVFAGAEAQDLLYWLKAVAAPQDSRQVRAGLATGMMGFDLPTLSALAWDDQLFDGLSNRLHQLHSVWVQQGVLAMVRQTLYVFGLPAKWLSDLDGERRLTNVLHLAELLQEASDLLDGHQAVIRWLSEQLTSESGAADDQVVRLESDSDLVKVITIHKSKGLEFPVVCLPFATGYKKTTAAKASFLKVTDEKGLVHLSLEPDATLIEQADLDRLREDLRLLYVALTRPLYALWIGFSTFKVGNSKSSNLHEGAAGYLLGGPDPKTPEEWGDCLHQWAKGCDRSAVQLINLDDQVATTALLPRAEALPLAEPTNYPGGFDKRWAIGSFSYLVKAMESGGARQGVVPLPRVAEDEADVGEVGEVGDAAQRADPEGDLAWHAPAEPQAVILNRGLAQMADPAPWHTFGKGPLVGTFLHEQLEWLAQEKFGRAMDAPQPDLHFSPALAQRLQARCDRAGWGDQGPTVLNWLGHVVTTPLAPLLASLQQIDTILPEMEFWLPVQALDARALDQLCCQHFWPGQPRPPLPDRALHGMLMGFADLVFEHQGRFWVLDYKSNHLGVDAEGYGQHQLIEAMLAHRYDVQAALYLFALHRLLQARWSEHYDPAHHLGGALFLFLRGIDGPKQGCLELAGPLALLEGLTAMMDDAQGATL